MIFKNGGIVEISLSIIHNEISNPANKKILFYFPSQQHEPFFHGESISPLLCSFEPIVMILFKCIFKFLIFVHIYLTLFPITPSVSKYVFEFSNVYD